MKTPTMLRGILPATVTPLDADGRFVRAPFERLLDRLYAGGVHGVYVCGTTGEGPLLSRHDREAVAEAAIANTPDGCHVVVHVGAASMDETLALARHAATSKMACPMLGARTGITMKTMKVRLMTRAISSPSKRSRTIATTSTRVTAADEP